MRDLDCDGEGFLEMVGLGDGVFGGLFFFKKKIRR